MEISIVLAEILGIWLLVAGLEALFNWKSLAAALEEGIQHRGVFWLMGVLALFFGAVVVSIQNLWVPDWRVIVTIFGWIGLLKGIFIMLFPNTAAKFYRSFATKAGCLIPVGIIAILLGLLMLYVGLAAV